MTKEEFTEALLDLGSFYDKKIDSEMVIQWYNDFGWLWPSQFENICREAKKACDRFPSGKFIFDAIRERDIQRPGSHRVGESYVTVICRCGEAYVIRKSDLKIPHSFFPLWDKSKTKGCQNCNAMYAGELILTKLRDDLAFM